MSIEKIHASLINHQRHQMVEQINKYGVYQFWQAYKEFLADDYFDETRYEHFTNACIYYFVFCDITSIKSV